MPIIYQWRGLKQQKNSTITEGEFQNSKIFSMLLSQDVH